MTDPFRLDGRTVIVTGASRGIGAEVARAIVAQGGGVVLVARSKGALDDLAGSLDGPVRTVAGDVADTTTAADALDAAEELDGVLWGLVNNAGINPFYHPVTDTPLSEWDEILRVNVLGAAAMARAVGREMATLGQGGRIVNLSSIAGLTGLPNIGPYNASKFAVRGLTEAIWLELRETDPHIAVIRVHPGGIKTNVARNAKLIKRLREDEAGLLDAAEEFEKAARTTPEVAAETIVRGMERGDHRVLIGPDARVIDWIVRLFPVSYYQKIGAFLGGGRS